MTGTVCLNVQDDNLDIKARFAAFLERLAVYEVIDDLPLDTALLCAVKAAAQQDISARASSSPDQKRASTAEASHSFTDGPQSNGGSSSLSTGGIGAQLQPTGRALLHRSACSCRL